MCPRHRVIGLLQVNKNTVQLVPTSSRKLQSSLKNNTVILHPVELAETRLRTRTSGSRVSLQPTNNHLAEQAPPWMHKRDAPVVTAVSRIIPLVQWHQQRMVQHRRVTPGNKGVEQLCKDIPNSPAPMASNILQRHLPQGRRLPRRHGCCRKPHLFRLHRLVLHLLQRLH